MSVLDIIAVKQSNGAFKTSPFYIRFNRRAPEKTVVDVYINDQLVKNESSFQLVVNKGFKGVVFENIAESSKQSKNGTQEQPTPNSAGEDLAIDEELQHLHSTMPPSTYVEQFNLKQEINTIHFKLGKQETVKASLFVWDHTTKIVISDVDGTITKSDVIGPFAIKLGVQYFRPNTAAMLTSIHRAGYKILYLTRKPMSHIEFVRQFISKITQDGDTMPPGPVISTPYKDYYELAIKIWQGPTVFKKSMLKCIRGLYPEDHRPLEAGFGDKPTDIEAYIYAGVDPKKCFQIDKHGSVSVSAESKTYQGYLGVQNAVDKLFPSLSEAAAMITTELSQTVGNYVVDAGKSAVGSEP